MVCTHQACTHVTHDHLYTLRIATIASVSCPCRSHAKLQPCTSRIWRKLSISFAQDSFVWFGCLRVPQTRNSEGTHNLLVNNVVSSATQADAINLHGYIRDAVVQNCHFKNTGDDGYVLWGADLEPENVTFKDSTIVNTGILRPNWYGVCVATYGAKSVIFHNITCRSPTLAHPIPPPKTNGTWNKGCARIDGTMAIIYTVSNPARESTLLSGHFVLLTQVL